jgi:hypothetical protein
VTEKEETYRGFRIVPDERVQLGYRLGEGTRSRPGKGRKLLGYIIFYPDSDATKFFTSRRAAHAYIDSYHGDGP